MNECVSSLRGQLPWTRSCFVCGEENPRGLHARSRLEANGCVVLEYITRETDVGYRHIIHGGILMTLADEAMTWAAIAATRQVCVAVEISARLRKPVAPGEALRVEAVCDSVRSRLVSVRARILNSQTVEVASTVGKYVPMRPEDARLAEKDFVTSPECLPPQELTSPEKQALGPREPA